MSQLQTLDFYTNSSEKLIEIYKNILVSNGIHDPISKVTSEDPGLRGEGAGSDRRNVTVEFENPNLTPLQLFAKLEVKGNPDHLELTSGLRYFEKESLFLTKYVAEAKELCKRKGLDKSIVTNIYPKCYYADKKAIIMENLKVGQGYTILGKEEPHDWHILIVALKTLAYHHAISYAMIEDAGGPEDFFRHYPVLKFEPVGSTTFNSKLGSWLQSCMNTNMKILRLNSHVKGCAEALASLTKLQEQHSSVVALCLACLQPKPNELLLLGHGDYWYTNMLFLKDPITGKIVGEKALDFQGVRYNSPAIDLAYYLYISANTDIRQTRLRDLLQIYLTNLRQLSADLGYPIDLSLDTLLAQFGQKLYIGLAYAFVGRYGPSMSIMSSVDMTKVEGDWGEFMGKAAEEWIAKNTEHAESMAKEIVSVVIECENLANGIFL